MIQEGTAYHRSTVEQMVGKLHLEVHDVGEVFAQVNHNRWIADCPACNGAEFVSRDRDFLCGSCGGRATVRWPRPRKQIEAVLEERPDWATRNWRPGETVDMLRAENLERGI